MKIIDNNDYYCYNNVDNKFNTNTNKSQYNNYKSIKEDDDKNNNNNDDFIYDNKDNKNKRTSRYYKLYTD